MRSTRICGPTTTSNFLPHGTARDNDAALHPILLTTAEHNPNGAKVRFLIDGVPIPADAASYDRIVLMFDGEDEDAVAAARERWSEAKAQGFDTDLLAARRAGALGQEGLSAEAPLTAAQGRRQQNLRLPRW